MKTQKSASFFSRLMKKSRILSVCERISAWFRQKLPDSFVSHLFAAEKRHSENGLLASLTARIPLRRRVILPVKRFAARHFERSVLLRALRRWIAKLPALPLKCVGIFYFAFGAYTDVAYLIRRYATGAALTERDFYLGLLMVLIGALLTGSGKTCGEAIGESRFASLLLFSLLGIPREAFRAKEAPRGRGNVAFIVGLCFGALGDFFGPSAVLLALTLTVFGYAVLILPEVGVILLAALLPFLSATHTALLCSFVTVCWLLKLIRGKRLLATVSLDLAVLAFAFLLLMSGVFSVDGTTGLATAGRLISLLMGYFLAVNLLRTSAWIKRAVTALLLSLGIGSVFAVGKAAIRLLLPEALHAELFSLLPSGVLSLLADHGVLAAGMILLLPFLFTSLSRAEGDAKIGYGLMTVLAFLSLLLFPTAGGWIGAAVMIVLYLLLIARHSFAKLVTAVAVLPFLLVLLPASLWRAIASVFAGEGQISAASRALEKLIGDCFAGGIGLGEDALSYVFPLYSSASAEGVSASYSLYTHLILAVGVTGLLFFFAILLIFFRHLFSYLAARREDESFAAQTTAAALSGIVGVLVVGCFTNFFADDRLFLLFWLILGLASAAVRTALRERIPQYLEGPYLEIDCNSSETSLRRKVR